MKPPMHRVPGCDIVLLVDAETGAPARNGGFRVDAGSVEAQVLQALRQCGMRVVVAPFSADARQTLQTLQALAPPVIFNLTEWIDGDRARDHEITGLLDRQGFRYTGTSGAGLRLARDKAHAKAAAAKAGVGVPREFSPPVNRKQGSLPHPVFVKPRSGDGSDAISGAALVHNHAALRERVRSLRKRKLGPALCEEYIEGRDIFVALLGNKPDVLHPLELVVGKQGRGAPRFATRLLKHDEAYKRRWRVSYREAVLPRAVLAEIRRASRRIFHALKLRDYARLDFRLTADNRLYFIEANPNPDLGRHTFGRERCFAGVEYPALIRRIVRAALARSV
jgi:D-alanine-D-alanine ligase